MVKSRLKLGGGWLAPDGTFHPCQYGAHISAARRILKKLGQSPRYGALDSLGWLHVGGGQVHRPLVVQGGKVGGTQAQFDTLCDLRDVAREAGWDVHYLDIEIEHWTMRENLGT